MVLKQRRSPVKKLLVASMLAAFAATVALPMIFTTDNAVAAEKKLKSKKKLEKKRKPTGGM
jgi:hypothetical protein